MSNENTEWKITFNAESLDPAIAEKLKNIKLQSFAMPRYIDEEFLEETKENVE